MKDPLLRLRPLRRARLAAALSLVALVAQAGPNRLGAGAAERYLDHVKFLASPELEGRGAGTPGIGKAADYIERKFREIGLEPGGEKGAYRQGLIVTTGAEMADDNLLIVRHVEGEESLEPGEDYTPISFSSSGAVSGPVVFAGYGVTADEFGYDDYAHFDVRDKIVVVLRYEPPSFSKNGNGRHRRFTRHAHLIAKAINARNRGAKALILVNGKRPDAEEDELIRFGSIAGPDDSGILMVQAKTAAVEKWLRRSGKSLRLLQEEIDGRGEPLSFALAEKFKLTLHVDIERTKARVDNVLGFLPGESDEYLVIGAHYDHLGLGNISSLAPDRVGEPHVGADDNASGTAGVIELARAFAAADGRRRGILFIAFCGEEIGLLGSAHWVENPTRPLERAVAMINMDMIGRVSKSKIYVGGVGTAAMFSSLVEHAAESYEFKLDNSKSGYSASDHTSFTAKGVPVLFFFSGLHADYHKPSDTWEKINAAEAVRLLALVGDVAERILGADERPLFVKTAPAAAGAHASGDGGGGRGYGPYFGSIPDFGEIPEGVKFADIRTGSPAEKAGLKAGDILTEFDGKPIKNLYDFTYALRDSKVGQTVTVKYLRDGRAARAQVTLERRR